ncbi:hypothetical protein F5Y17DRAFT_475858 [Xylariaceae sp. FL0594]|nr:hypothetical protein F5Y17DRAFT_475858 [Xylariaceae sp. FL0594]
MLYSSRDGTTPHGRDSTLSWCFYQPSKYPERSTRLRAEILKGCRENATAAQKICILAHPDPDEFRAREVGRLGTPAHDNSRLMVDRGYGVVRKNLAMTEWSILVSISQKYSRTEYRSGWQAQKHEAAAVGRPKDGVRMALLVD